MKSGVFIGLSQSHRKHGIRKSILTLWPFGNYPNLVAKWCGQIQYLPSANAQLRNSTQKHVVFRIMHRLTYEMHAVYAKTMANAQITTANARYSLNFSKDVCVCVLTQFLSAITSFHSFNKSIKLWKQCRSKWDCWQFQE